MKEEQAIVPDVSNQGGPASLSDFEAIARRYRPGLVRFIFKRMRDYHMAEDLCQEVLYRAYRALDTLESPEKLQGWLYSVAFHVTVDWLRSQSVPRKVAAVKEWTRSLEVSTPSTEAVMVQRDEGMALQRDKVRLWRAVRKLPPIYRQVIELRYNEWRPIARISRMTGISEANIKVRLFRARYLLSKMCRHQDIRDRLCG
jgi:RNA polymerase sigma-70 factor (ECF subfamily)